MPHLGPEGLFQLDERSLKAISELQYRLRAQSSAEVIRAACFFTSSPPKIEDLWAVLEVILAPVV
jgi:hypothetical protein